MTFFPDCTSCGKPVELARTMDRKVVTCFACKQKKQAKINKKWRVEKSKSRALQDSKTGIQQDV